MSDTPIRKTITKLFNQKPLLEGIAADQEFFDLGASSLTVVDLQIQIESELGFEVDTSTLMKDPTIDGWVAAYSAKQA